MSEIEAIYKKHWERPDQDGDASGECTCGDEWPCDVEKLHRLALRARPQEPGDLISRVEGIAVVRKELEIGGWSSFDITRLRSVIRELESLAAPVLGGDE